MLFEVIEGNKNCKENGYFSISLKQIRISKFCDMVPSILILIWFGIKLTTVFQFYWNKHCIVHNNYVQYKVCLNGIETQLLIYPIVSKSTHLVYSVNMSTDMFVLNI